MFIEQTADRLAGTYYDSGIGAVTISGNDQRAGAAPIQVTAAVQAVNHSVLTHSRTDQMNSTPLMRTTGNNRNLSYTSGF